MPKHTLEDGGFSHSPTSSNDDRCTVVNKGEEQKKLDVLSNEVFVKALVSSGRTCILVSEENEVATFVELSKCGNSDCSFNTECVMVIKSVL
ncbi:hypothetical protein V6N13_114447 [Hibiscus sabdariffa]